MLNTQLRIVKLTGCFDPQKSFCLHFVAFPVHQISVRPFENVVFYLRNHKKQQENQYNLQAVFYFNNKIYCNYLVPSSQWPQTA